MLKDGTKPGQGPGDEQPFHNPVREGLPTIRPCAPESFLRETPVGFQANIERHGGEGRCDGDTEMRRLRLR